MSNPLPNAYGFSGLPGFDDSGDVLSGWDTHTCFDDCDDELGPDSAMLRLLSRASDNDPDAGLVSANSLGNRLLDGHGIVAEASTSGTTSNSLGYAAQLKAEKVRGTVIESPRQKCRHREKRSNDDPRFTGVNSEINNDGTTVGSSARNLSNGLAHNLPSVQRGNFNDFDPFSGVEGHQSLDEEFVQYRDYGKRCNGGEPSLSHYTSTASGIDNFGRDSESGVYKVDDTDDENQQLLSFPLGHQNTEEHGFGNHFLYTAQQGPTTVDSLYQPTGPEHTGAGPSVGGQLGYIPTRRDLAWTKVHGNDLRQRHFVNVFASLDDARGLATEHCKMPSKHDLTIPQTLQEHIAVVERLYLAMMKVDGTEDCEPGKKPPQAWANFANGKYTMGEVQAVCWELLELCKSKQLWGALLPPRQRTGKQSTAEFESFEDLLVNLCNALELRKTICKRAMEAFYIKQLVDNPAMHVARARQNKKLNTNKGVQIGLGREWQKKVTTGKRARSTESASSGDERGGSKMLKLDCDSTVEQSLVRQHPVYEDSPSTVGAVSKAISPSEAHNQRVASYNQDLLGVLDPDLGGSDQSATAAVESYDANVPPMGLVSKRIGSSNGQEQSWESAMDPRNFNFQEHLHAWGEEPKKAANAHGIQMAHADSMRGQHRRMSNADNRFMVYERSPNYNPLSHLDHMRHTTTPSHNQIHQVGDAQHETFYASPPPVQYRPNTYGHSFQSEQRQQEDTVIPSTESNEENPHVTTHRPTTGRGNKRKAADDGSYEPSKKRGRR